ncbi:MAG: hypothetical protein AABW63_03350 [Nanoarchaeota archaeon]
MTRVSLDDILQSNGKSTSDKSSLEKGFYKIADFGLKTFQEDSNHKIIREIGLTLFSSFYGGSVLPHDQEHIENKLGLNPGTLTKYSATRGQILFLGLEYVGAFHFLEPIVNLIPYINDLNNSIDGVENAYLINAAVSIGCNIFRYIQSKKGKRIPAISLYTLGILGLQHGVRGVKWTYKQVKAPIKEKLREVKEEADWLLRQ